MSKTTRKVIIKEYIEFSQSHSYNGAVDSQWGFCVSETTFSIFYTVS